MAYDDHVQSGTPAEVRADCRSDSAKGDHARRSIPVNGDAKQGINQALAHHAGKQGRVLNLAAIVVVGARVAIIGIGQRRERQTQQAARVVVSEPIRGVREANLLLLDGDISNSDIGEAHGAGDNLAVSILDKHVGRRIGATVLEGIGVGLAKAAGRLGKILASVVNAVEVFANRPRVGAASVDEQRQGMAVPGGLNGILGAISRGGRDVLVAKATGMALVDAQNGSCRLAIEIHDRAMTMRDRAKLVDIMADRNDLGRRDRTNPLGNMVTDPGRSMLQHVWMEFSSSKPSKEDDPGDLRHVEDSIARVLQVWLLLDVAGTRSDLYRRNLRGKIDRWMKG